MTKLLVPANVLLRCAQAAHEMNRVYCLSIGDLSQRDWESASEWQRSSALEGVKDVYRGKTPDELHLGWAEKKRKEGWVHGPVKDEHAKPPTHPCLAPDGEADDRKRLPLEQQRKDQIFRSTVEMMGAALGWPITGDYAVD